MYKYISFFLSLIAIHIFVTTVTNKSVMLTESSLVLRVIQYLLITKKA
jgi:hypothetical protein